MSQLLSVAGSGSLESQRNLSSQSLEAQEDAKGI